MKAIYFAPANSHVNNLRVKLKIDLDIPDYVKVFTIAVTNRNYKEEARNIRLCFFFIKIYGVSLFDFRGLDTSENRIIGDECIDSVKSALQSGVRLIDTASPYRKEEVGRAVREAIEGGMIEREDIFVITKIYPSSEMANPEEFIRACLDRLNIPNYRGDSGVVRIEVCMSEIRRFLG